MDPQHLQLIFAENIIGSSFTEKSWMSAKVGYADMDLYKYILQFIRLAGEWKICGKQFVFNTVSSVFNNILPHLGECPS
jgi:hypothetical protein